MTIKCMLVDDEPPAIDLLKSHLRLLNDLEVVAACHSAVEAFEVLKKQPVDLLFLDIQMPVLTGLDFLKTLQDPPKVILTTAYRDYAIEGYDLDVVDYLLKPISFERFFKAVERYYQRVETPVFSPPTGTGKGFMYVNINKKNHKVLFDSILYIESLKDYVRIHTKEKSLVVKSNIGAIAEHLPQHLFLRTHRSYIIALNKITAYTAVDIEIGTIEIPIGTSYKEKVFQTLKTQSI
ncbi:putative response regulatory protein [Flavobacteriaceae bacterium UJ101]|nr:putative response regulatory protein [Flavobacteriaceae bacterium UJ101]